LSLLVLSYKSEEEMVEDTVELDSLETVVDKTLGEFESLNVVTGRHCIMSIFKI